MGSTDGREACPSRYTDGGYCAVNTGSVAVDMYGERSTFCECFKGSGCWGRGVLLVSSGVTELQGTCCGAGLVSRYASGMLVGNSCSNVLSHLHCSESPRSFAPMLICGECSLSFPGTVKRSRAGPCLKHTQIVGKVQRT